jgi:hypothetical protein
LCETYYYAGSKRLFAGDKAMVADYFQKSIVTVKMDCMKYSSGAAELKFLQVKKN